MLLIFCLQFNGICKLWSVVLPQHSCFKFNHKVTFRSIYSQYCPNRSHWYTINATPILWDCAPGVLAGEFGFGQTWVRRLTCPFSLGWTLHDLSLSSKALLNVNRKQVRMTIRLEERKDNRSGQSLRQFCNTTSTHIWRNLDLGIKRETVYTFFSRSKWSVQVSK